MLPLELVSGKAPEVSSKISAQISQEASIKVDHNNEANFPATQAGMWTDGIILLGTLICAILLLLLGAVVEQVNGEVSELRVFCIMYSSQPSRCLSHCGWKARAIDFHSRYVTTRIY